MASIIPKAFETAFYIRKKAQKCYYYVYYCIVNIAAKLQYVWSPETGINQPFSQHWKLKKNTLKKIK